VRSLAVAYDRGDGRALQIVFKSSLGAASTEIIRQQRLLRIREEMQENSDGHERRIVDVAQKSGVD
jgi:hypothetical protein